MRNQIISIFIISLVLAIGASAQTTEFSYQGSLKDGANQANGKYDFEFRLFDSLAAGGQIGPLLMQTVAVTNGTFAVKLNFGNFFNGADRFLEIRVRNEGGSGYTVLDPRQRIGSSPYAVKSLLAETANSANTANNALQLGGQAANQFVITTDPRMTNARSPTAGSGNYVQNTTNPQATSNFSISGTGKAEVFNATRRFDLNGEAILRAHDSNTMAGLKAGRLLIDDPNDFSDGNTFFGFAAGEETSPGPILSSANANSAFGHGAGRVLNRSSENSLFGSLAGGSLRDAHENTMIGRLAGSATTSGNRNVFLGSRTGETNITGEYNSLLGAYSNVTSSALRYATAIGAEAVASASNSIFLGRPGGQDTVRIPGNLITAGTTTLNGNLVHASGNLAVFNSPVRLVSISTGGETALCRRASDSIIATCGSSLRYKFNVNQFSAGLDLVSRLKPITFDWKDGGMHDLGLGAEDVAAIEPLLVTYNKDGQVEGVKYDRIGVVLINAIKEQQAQIATLTKLVCAWNKTADICKEK